MMEKIIGLVLAALLLAGCGGQETFETVADMQAEPAMASLRSIVVALPEGLATPTVQSNGDTLYQGEGFEVMLQTLPGGDLNATVRTVTGFDQGSLTVVETKQEELTRYEFVWASAGEAGDRVGRAVILDDGSYHYTVTVLTDADKTEQYRQVWEVLFTSVMLS